MDPSRYCTPAVVNRAPLQVCLFSVHFGLIQPLPLIPAPPPPVLVPIGPIWGPCLLIQHSRVVGNPPITLCVQDHEGSTETAMRGGMTVDGQDGLVHALLARDWARHAAMSPTPLRANWPPASSQLGPPNMDHSHDLANMDLFSVLLLAGLF